MPTSWESPDWLGLSHGFRIVVAASPTLASLLFTVGAHLLGAASSCPVLHRCLAAPSAGELASIRFSMYRLAHLPLDRARFKRSL